MNKWKQFWVLLGFQARVNPYIAVMPVVFGAPLLIAGTLPHFYHANLSSVLQVQNLFFVGFIAVWALVPEMATWGKASTWNSGTEFILTRAIDRPVLYRAKAAYLYLLVLVIPLAVYLYSFKHPDLEATEYSSVTRQACVAEVPGASLQIDPTNLSPLLAIRGGNVLVEQWHLWLFVLAALGVQVLLLLLCRLKHRMFLFYAVFLVGIMAPPLIDLYFAGRGRTTNMERIFFFFAGHQALCWLATALLLVATKRWCERRFARLEH